MEYFSIGEIIKEYRTRLGLTQEDLSYGIEPGTVSRIERGEHVPQAKVLKMIFSRMNMRLPLNLATELTETDYIRYRIEDNVQELEDLKKADYTELLNQYKSCCPEMNYIEEQFYCLYSAIQRTLKKQNDDDLKNLYIKTIKLSMPNFSSEYDFSNHKIITNFEMRAIFELSLLEYENKNYNIAENYFEKLIHYLESESADEEEKKKYLSKILFYTSEIKKIESDYKGMYEYAKKGVKVCYGLRIISFLGYLLCNTGLACMYLNKIEEAQTFIKQGIEFLSNCGRLNDAENINNFIYKAFNLELKI